MGSETHKDWDVGEDGSMFSYLNINTKKQQKQSIAEKMEAFSGGGTEGEMALSPGSDWTCPQEGSCGQMGLQLLGWSHHQMAPSPPSPEPLAPLCSLHSPSHVHHPQQSSPGLSTPGCSPGGSGSGIAAGGPKVPRRALR